MALFKKLYPGDMQHVEMQTNIFHSLIIASKPINEIFNMRPNWRHLTNRRKESLILHPKVEKIHSPRQNFQCQLCYSYQIVRPTEHFRWLKLMSGVPKNQSTKQDVSRKQALLRQTDKRLGFKCQSMFFATLSKK